MKRAILLIIIGAVIGGGAVWMCKRGDAAKPGEEKPAAEKPAGDESEKTTLTHDTNGNVVISMNDEKQGDAGIVVTNPVAAQLAPEMKGYGRVMDPTPLAALVTELASAQAAYAASSNELARLKSLQGQGNASMRSLQAAEATAARDQLAAQSARDRLILASGKAVAEQGDLPAFTQALTSQSAALVRIDLPPGEIVKSPPTGARLVTLSGNSAEAEFLGSASAVDPQIQGQGFLFLVKPGVVRFLAGEAVTGYLKLPGEPRNGVIVPREAVLRTEGKGWVYVLNEGGEAFTRREIPLDQPTETGWFISGGITAADFVVVTGAQTIFSEELSSGGFMSGSRD